MYKKDRLIVLDVSGATITPDLLMDKLDNLFTTKIVKAIEKSPGDLESILESTQSGSIEIGLVLLIILSIFVLVANIATYELIFGKRVKVFGGFVVSLGLIGGWLPLSFSVALTGLEILVAFLQAYVFAILTCIYLNDALNLHH